MIDRWENLLRLNLKSPWCQHFYYSLLIISKWWHLRWMIQYHLLSFLLLFHFLILLLVLQFVFFNLIYYCLFWVNLLQGLMTFRHLFISSYFSSFIFSFDFSLNFFGCRCLLLNSQLLLYHFHDRLSFRHQFPFYL